MFFDVFNFFSTFLFFFSIDLSKRTVVTLVGGPSKSGYMDGDCVTAQVDRPYGLCYDDTNALVYFCDAVNHRIRVIHLATNMVATVVGNGEEGMLFKNEKIKNF